ncbi:MAG: GNAT family N-acetyltransferase [Candidatus Poribacteria bacterium]|nr:GNAT family N-acetyltransferase [Candidatus Poribacteria bacterium]
MSAIHSFLTDPAPDKLLRAVAENHVDWIGTRHLQGGGEVLTDDEGCRYMHTSARGGEGSILFPEWSDATADGRIDAMIDYFLEKQPKNLVGCWSMSPTKPADLDIRMLARGFQPGWHPHWMWLDLERLNDDHPQPDGLVIESVEVAERWDAEKLPYYSHDDVETVGAWLAERPRRFWKFVAKLDGKIVGQSGFILGPAEDAIAGVYDCGVVPELRSRGIGKAVVAATCVKARELGARIAMLNATGDGERIYRRLGFESLGKGTTWWLNVQRLNDNPLTPLRVEFAEAVLRGDLDALNALAPKLTTTLLTDPTPNALTPIDLAVHVKQNDVGEWLIDHGVSLDVPTAWRFGWKERAAQLLKEKPELANHKSGGMGITPLHVAAWENEIELARLVLTANCRSRTMKSAARRSDGRTIFGARRSLR